MHGAATGLKGKISIPRCETAPTMFEIVVKVESPEDVVPEEGEDEAFTAQRSRVVKTGLHRR